MSKRRRERATIIPRGHKFAVVIDRGAVNGKRVRDWHSGFADYKSADRARTKLLAKLDASDLDKLYGDLLEAGLAAVTIAHVHETASKALRQARRWKLVPSNVAADASCYRRDWLRTETKGTAALIWDGLVGAGRMRAS